MQHEPREALTERCDYLYRRAGVGVGASLLLSFALSVLLWRARPPELVAFWQALMSASTDMTPTLGSIFQIVRGKDPHGPSADLFKARWKQYLKVWDTTLGKQKYAAGNEVTLADFSLYAGYARCKMAIPELVDGCPNAERWAKEMAARPAIQRALKF